MSCIFDLRTTHVLEYDIVCRYPIRGNEKKCLIVDFEDLADFAAGNLLQTMLFQIDRCDGIIGRHCVGSLGVKLVRMWLLIYVYLTIGGAEIFMSAEVLFWGSGCRYNNSSIS